MIADVVPGDGGASVSERLRPTASSEFFWRVAGIPRFSSSLNSIVETSGPMYWYAGFFPRPSVSETFLMRPRLCRMFAMSYNLRTLVSRVFSTWWIPWITLAAKSRVRVCGWGETRNSIRNFWVLIPMLVPFGSFGEL